MSKYKRDDQGISTLRFIIYVIASVAVLTFFDRFTKYLAEAFLKGNDGITLIDKTLRLYYLENRGAAWGMFQGMQWIFLILTTAFIVIAVIYFIKVPKNRYYLPLNICITVLLAGAVGNFVDRVVNRYVIDFIYFEIINFPIFNVADIYVTLSVIGLFVLILFKYKDGDFFFLKKKESRKKEIKND